MIDISTIKDPVKNYKFEWEKKDAREIAPKLQIQEEEKKSEEEKEEEEKKEESDMQDNNDLVNVDLSISQSKVGCPSSSYLGSSIK